MAQNDEQETTDEVVRETRAIKESLAKSMDFDVSRILDDARRKQDTSERTIRSAPVPKAAT